MHCPRRWMGRKPVLMKIRLPNTYPDLKRKSITKTHEWMDPVHIVHRGFVWSANPNTAQQRLTLRRIHVQQNSTRHQFQVTWYCCDTCCLTLLITWPNEYTKQSIEDGLAFSVNCLISSIRPCVHYSLPSIVNLCVLFKGLDKSRTWSALIKDTVKCVRKGTNTINHMYKRHHQILIGRSSTVSLGTFQCQTTVFM